MTPTALLFIILLQPNKESTASYTQNSTGIDFIVAFPENIAYYHPSASDNKILVTALFSNTRVTITPGPLQPETTSLQMGKTKVFYLDRRMELMRAPLSSQTLRITSSKTITVQTINQKESSIQTTLVVSVDKLGMAYPVPPITKPKGMTGDQVDITEGGPFKLIIINSDIDNLVTLDGTKAKTVFLKPYELAQFWLNDSDALQMVTAEQPVAVLFSHPCVVRDGCTCNMLITPLTPASEKKLSFYIPPTLAKDVEEQTFLLIVDKTTTSITAFNPYTVLMRVFGPVIVYRPGLLLNLIPEEDFSSCYVLYSIPNVSSFALIVAPENERKGMRMGTLPLEDPDWQVMRGTKFASTLIPLRPGRNTIWHTSSKMAVYSLGKRNSVVFGNPAPSISKYPDYRGCILSPEVMEVGLEANSWPESVQYCRERQLELISLDNVEISRQMASRLQEVQNSSQEQAWIGLRRSSLTGEWYWVSGAPFGYANWLHGEPGSTQEGQCAMMSLDVTKDFSWTDQECCTNALPVCYRGPILFPLD